jgi:hypothetical protein
LFATGGVKLIKLFLWDITLCCDYLGKQSLRPFMESASAHQFCGDCNYDTRSPAAGKPFSFLRRQDRSGGCKSQRVASFKLRTFAELKRELDTVSGLTAAKRAAALQAAGFNKSVYAWNDKYIPGADPCGVPQDALHLFPDGLLRSECAWLLYILFALGLDITAVNTRIRSYRGLPADVRIPALVEKLKEGKAGRPKSSATLRMTGSQVMHFSLHRCGCSCAPRALRTPRTPRTPRNQLTCTCLPSLQHQHSQSIALGRDAGASSVGQLVQAR